MANLSKLLKNSLLTVVLCQVQIEVTVNTLLY